MCSRRGHRCAQAAEALKGLAAATRRLGAAACLKLPGGSRNAATPCPSPAPCRHLHSPLLSTHSKHFAALLCDPSSRCCPVCKSILQAVGKGGSVGRRHGGRTGQAPRTRLAWASMHAAGLQCHPLFDLPVQPADCYAARVLETAVQQGRRMGKPALAAAVLPIIQRDTLRRGGTKAAARCRKARQHAMAP